MPEAAEGAELGNTWEEEKKKRGVLGGKGEQMVLGMRG